jgi:predicted outer membrane repeat protein
VLGGNFSLPSQTLPTGANLTLIDILNVFSPRTIQLSGTGSLFTIGSGRSLTLQDITLEGSSTNDAPLVTVSSGGTFTMSGNSSIIDNIYIGTAGVTTNGGGVNVTNGTFIMSGGMISGNKAINTMPPSSGGGVFVTGGTFTMSGGTITDNEAGGGGGVYVHNSILTMSGNATVKDNTASSSIGGGVYFGGSSPSSTHLPSFTMDNNATISGNKATTNGGGVYFTTSMSPTTTFEMKGGTIGGTTDKNIADQGGGVYVTGSASEFTMSGGTVYGVNGNTATIEGAALYVNTSAKATYGDGSSIPDDSNSTNTPRFRDTNITGK